MKTNESEPEDVDWAAAEAALAAAQQMLEALSELPRSRSPDY
jgi:hypothetical protein